MKKAISLILIICLLFSFSACKPAEETASRSGIFFDTFIKLSVFGADDGLLDSAFRLLEEYDELLSKDSPSSDVSRLNSANGKEIEINKKTADMISSAFEYEELSNGAFSITLGALSGLWNFGSEGASVPKKADLDKALEASKNGEIILNGTKARLTNGAKLDLGAFAKGYIADEIKKLYEKENKSGIIDLGGNILAVGKKPSGEDFSIGIKDPESPDKIKFTIYSEAVSVVTSGIYERNFIQNGTLYHHILDADSGFPAETGLLSVSVVSPSSSSADALSTALFCLGAQEGLKLVESLQNTEAVFIDKEGEALLSSGLVLKKDKIYAK